MSSKKILIIIPDGVSLRNFVFSQFPEELKKAGWHFVFLNFTTFDLKAIGLKEIRINPEPSPWTDLFKRAKILIELGHFKKKFNDPVFDKYRFPPKKEGFRNKVKNLLVGYLVRKYGSVKGLSNIRQKIKDSERGTDFYDACREILGRENPDMVFCTNQRPVNAVSPITAAQDLGIPTSCFIFSWDNLPKATKIVDSDYYFVWSNYMKEELKNYYPHINDDQIKITGTPQFEIHLDEKVIVSKEEFCSTYGLDLNKSYVCFSGDDITTSPHDEVFLQDVAEELQKLNNEGYNFGIIFRRCPVDFSGRYDEVLTKYRNVVVSIDPLWYGNTEQWNSVMPTEQDQILQTNIVHHSIMVINVGSSMVFDFAARFKPCAYLNYVPEIKDIKKDIREVYDYKHFRSMPKDQAVYWINSKSGIREIIQNNEVNGNQKLMENALKWFEKVNNEKLSSKKLVVECNQLVGEFYTKLSRREL